MEGDLVAGVPGVRPLQFERAKGPSGFVCHFTLQGAARRCALSMRPNETSTTGMHTISSIAYEPTRQRVLVAGTYTACPHYPFMIDTRTHKEMGSETHGYLVMLDKDLKPVSWLTVDSTGGSANVLGVAVMNKKAYITGYFEGTELVLPGLKGGTVTKGVLATSTTQYRNMFVAKLAMDTTGLTKVQWLMVGAGSQGVSIVPFNGNMMVAGMRWGFPAQNLARNISYRLPPFCVGYVPFGPKTDQYCIDDGVEWPIDQLRPHDVASGAFLLALPSDGSGVVYSHVASVVPALDSLHVSKDKDLLDSLCISASQEHLSMVNVARPWAQLRWVGPFEGGMGHAADWELFAGDTKNEAQTRDLQRRVLLQLNTEGKVEWQNDIFGMAPPDSSGCGVAAMSDTVVVAAFAEQLQDGNLRYFHTQQLRGKKQKGVWRTSEEKRVFRFSSVKVAPLATFNSSHGMMLLLQYFSNGSALLPRAMPTFNMSQLGALAVLHHSMQDPSGEYADNTGRVLVGGTRSGNISWVGSQIVGLLGTGTPSGEQDIAKVSKHNLTIVFIVAVGICVFVFLLAVCVSFCRALTPAPPSSRHECCLQRWMRSVAQFCGADTAYSNIGNANTGNSMVLEEISKDRTRAPKQRLSVLHDVDESEESGSDGELGDVAL